MAEMLYGMVDGVLTGRIIGDRGRPYVPFVFTLFLLIVTLNLIGSRRPADLHVTSQLAVTATLAVMTFTTVFIVGFVTQRPALLQAVLAVGHARGDGPLPGADRDDLLLGPAAHPGACVCSATCWAATW